MNRIQVTVAYALPEAQFDVPLELPLGATVADALAAVADQAPFAELDLRTCPVGVFAEPVEDRSRALTPGDRVEIYRELLLDPMAARRERAAAQRAGSGASAKSRPAH